MAITASQIATNNTLEQFRQEFNNLQTDVNGLEAGTLTFSEISATTVTTGGDLELGADAAALKFGADGDIILTHVHNTGLLFNSTSQLQFGDSGTYIHQSADGVLDLVSDTEIEINATTIDINGAIVASGAYTGGGVMTTGGNIVIPNDGNIGSVGDTDSIAISSSGVVTFSQSPVFPDGSIAVADLDIDGATDIGEAIVDADLFIVDNGAGGTNRKTAASRLKTYIGAISAADDLTAGDAAVNLTTSSGDITVDSNAGAVSIDGHTGVTLASSNSGNITLDSVADIILDAAGNDFNFKAGGTEVLRITNSSSDVIIKPIVDAKDLIFQQRDGTEVARIEDNATFNVVTGKLAINGTAITSTAAELNLLDGVSGLVQADLTKLAALDATAVELNYTDGVTSAIQTQMDTKTTTGKAVAFALVFG